MSRKSSACKLRGTRPDAVALPPTVAILENSPTSRVTDEASTGNPSTVKRELVVLPSVIHPLLLFFSRVLFLASSRLTFSLSQFLLVSLFYDLTPPSHPPPPPLYTLPSVSTLRVSTSVRFAHRLHPWHPRMQTLPRYRSLLLLHGRRSVYIRPDWLVCCPFVCTCVSFAMGWGGGGVWLVRKSASFLAGAGEI